MTFHTTPQFHTTISHHTLFLTTPFCTTSHSVVHPGHRHSTSHNIPFHITPYNKYISSAASFYSALNTHLFSSALWLLCLCAWSCVPLVSCVCVCSGNIPHHKCCSVYGISRVEIAFHTTQLHTTLNIFTSHIISSRHTTFHVTPFHTTPFHIAPPLYNIPHHITAYHMFHTTSHRHLMSQHISPRTTIFYVWHHITPQSASHHHFTPPLTSQSTTYSTSHSHSPHLTPFHVHNYSTPHPHSTSQHISYHTVFHIALHHHILILHNTTTSDTTTHCIIFHIWHHTTITPHIAYATFFIITIPHHHSSHSNFPHTRTPHSTPRYIPHHTFCISVIPHHTMSEIATFHIAPHFRYTSHHISHRTIIHIKSLHTSRHTIQSHHAHISPCTTPCTSPHSDINDTSHYPTAHIPNQTTLPTLHFNHHSAWHHV